jgi:hypothetical protein
MGRFTISRYCSPCRIIIGFTEMPGMLNIAPRLAKLGITPKVGSAFRPFS